MGGTLAVMIVALIISQFAYQRAEPHRRAIYTAGTAWLICAVIGGMTLPGGLLGGLIGYSLGGLLAGIERYYRYQKFWTDDDQPSDDAEIFR